MCQSRNGKRHIDEYNAKRRHTRLYWKNFHNLVALLIHIQNNYTNTHIYICIHGVWCMVYDVCANICIYIHITGMGNLCAALGTRRSRLNRVHRCVDEWRDDGWLWPD